MSDIEQKAREARDVFDRLNDEIVQGVHAALDELATLKDDNRRLEELLAVKNASADILRADLADARRGWDAANFREQEMMNERDEARRESDEARAEVLKAQEAMDNGADDSRWVPGTTAVDSLIRERDEARVALVSLMDVYPADTNGDAGVVEGVRAHVERLTTERDEAVRLLRDAVKAGDELRSHALEVAEMYGVACDGVVPNWNDDTASARAFLSKFPSAEPAKESEARCLSCNAPGGKHTMDCPIPKHTGQEFIPWSADYD